MTRTFQIIPKDWYKRRKLSGTQIKPVSVVIPDYQESHNHICNMVVTYSDQSSKTLISRVLYNSFTDKWTVDGMEVAVLVQESNVVGIFNEKKTG